MAACSFIKVDSTRCRAQAMKESQWCYTHAPELAIERDHNNRKGGRTGGRGRPKGGAEMGWVKQRLREVTEGVLEGSVEKGRAAVAIQGLNAYRGAVMAEWELAFEERVTELERRAEEMDRYRKLG